MGIDNAAAKMILLLSNIAGENLSNSLILGHQRNYIGMGLRRRLASELNIPLESLSGKYADSFIRSVGADNFQILDISKYEQAQIIHDLSTPIPQNLKGKFSVVMDIGTSEHVYNVSQSLSNIRDMCAEKGQVLMLSPANNYLGHGFYQFSPELFFRTFGKEYGFEIDALYLIKNSLFKEKWYELTDPKVLKRRGTINTARRCYIGVIATKISEPQVLQDPFQSDYIEAWNEVKVTRMGSIYLKSPFYLRRVLDFTVIAFLSRVRNRIKPKKFQWEKGSFIPK
jgi:hypothetical protein